MFSMCSQCLMLGLSKGNCRLFSAESLCACATMSQSPSKPFLPDSKVLDYRIIMRLADTFLKRDL